MNSFIVDETLAIHYLLIIDEINHPKMRHKNHLVSGKLIIHTGNLKYRLLLFAVFQMIILS